MTIDLSSLGTAMYYSTAARKQQMDMDREQGQIVAEQQQNQLRQQQMANQIKSDKESDRFYKEEFPKVSLMSKLGQINAYEKEAARMDSLGDGKRATFYKASATQLREDAKLEDKEQKQKQIDLKQSQAMIGYSYLQEKTPYNKKMLWDTLVQNGVAPEKLPRSEEAMVEAAKKLQNDGFNFESKVKFDESTRKYEQDRDDKLNAKKEKDREFKIKMGLLAQQKEAANIAKEEKITGQMERAEKLIESGNSVASAIEKISALSSGTTTGFLPNLTTKDGMFNAVRNMAGRNISTTEEKMMNTIFVGLGRDLATLEAGGAATGLVGLAEQMKAGLYILPGDDIVSVAQKLADIKRITLSRLEPKLRGKLLKGAQAEEAQRVIDTLNILIPYDMLDVIKAARGEKSTPTIGEASKKASGVQVRPEHNKEETDLINKYLKK